MSESLPAFQVLIYLLAGLALAYHHRTPAAPLDLPEARPSERLKPGRKIDQARLRASWVDRARKAGAL